MLSELVLKIIACPKCKGDLDYKPEQNKLTCRTCRLKFNIIDGSIPDMIIEHAERF